MGANINDYAEQAAERNESQEIDMFFENNFEELSQCSYDVKRWFI